MFAVVLPNSLRKSTERKVIISKFQCNIIVIWVIEYILVDVHRNTVKIRGSVA